MADTAPPPGPTPERTDPMADSYAIYVAETVLHVWQYRHSVSEPDGQWQFVETYSRTDQPRLDIEGAMLSPPTADGYWVYATDYDCVLGCN